MVRGVLGEPGGRLPGKLLTHFGMMMFHMTSRQFCRGASAALLFIVFWAWSLLPVARAQTPGTTPLWRMNITQGASPAFGWGCFDPSRREGIQWRTTFVAAGGPGGRDAAQVAFIPLGSGGFGANVWDCGNTGTFQQGRAYYIRYYIYYSDVTDLHRSQDNDFWGVKTTLIGASPDSYRAIETSAPHTGALNLQIRFGKNIDGPPHETSANPDPLLRVGWNAVQLGVVTSTTATSGNGGYRVWLNNDNLAAPSSSSAFATSQQASAMGGLGLLIAMEPINSPLTIKIGAYEYDDEFDAGWSARMGTGGSTTPPPSAPLNPRIQ